MKRYPRKDLTLQVKDIKICPNIILIKTQNDINQGNTGDIIIAKFENNLVC